MANPNNTLCKHGRYCPPLGRCVETACPEEAFLPNVTAAPCIQLAKLACLSSPNSFEAAACTRGTLAPFQAPGAMSHLQLADMIYFPEGYLRGLAASRKCS